MTNPYAGLPLRAFWRTGVAEGDPFSPASVWRPKFNLSASATFATAGSCFAQQIGRNLVRHGLNWLNAEPGPPGLPPDQRMRFNYDLFTFRTGNIYTTPLLWQWLSWGLHGQAPPAEIWRREDRFLDPFRPAIEPDGFASPEELLQSRCTMLENMVPTIARTDCFIFTLGLSEMWVNLEGGYVYPNCPGTVGGSFDPSCHRFRNGDYGEIYEALSASIILLRSVNPEIKVILTVSPQPLTATASGEHALVANAYTKSVLRTVAGSIAVGDAGVDYFPSYELITNLATRGALFRSNLRAVTPSGVDIATRAFLEGLGFTAPAEADTAPRIASTEGSREEDVVCEDSLLETFNAAIVPADR